MAQSAKKSSPHKFKGRNDRESRRKYWLYDKLKLHKVRNLIRCNGMDRNEAVKFWNSVRIRRIKK